MGNDIVVARSIIKCAGAFLMGTSLIAIALTSNHILIGGCVIVFVYGFLEFVFT